MSTYPYTNVAKSGVPLAMVVLAYYNDLQALYLQPAYLFRLNTRIRVLHTNRH